MTSSKDAKNAITLPLKPFNAPIKKERLNIKNKQRANLLPWRGQFSPQLVEEILLAYYPGSGIILDPFLGSGTLLSEAARIGAPAIGSEINPAAFMLSKMHTFANLDIECRQKVLLEAESVLTKSQHSPLSGAKAFHIPLELRETGRNNDTCVIEPYVDLLLSVFQLLSYSVPNKTTLWKRLSFFIINLPYSKHPLKVVLADARRLPLKENSIEFILTSPPYVNVMNYHHQHRLGVEKLGWNVLEAAKSEIGSNRKFRQNRFLTVIQYVLDMALAFLEMTRVARNHARIVLVVGRSSKVLGVQFSNSKLLAELATSLGFELHLRQERVFQNRYGKNIYEDILNITPSATLKAMSSDEALEKAREVALSALSEAKRHVPQKNIKLLKEAIQQIESVQPSPIFDPNSAKPSNLQAELLEEVSPLTRNYL